MHPFSTHASFMAIFISTLVYWLFGMLWFSVLMGRSWSVEIEKTGIKIQKPSKNGMILKSALTFLLNFVIVWGISFFVHALNRKGIFSAITLGLTLGVCFAATTKAISCIWEGRSLRLALIEVGYPIIGVTISSVILTLWK